MRGIKDIDLNAGTATIEVKGQDYPIVLSNDFDIHTSMKLAFYGLRELLQKKTDPEEALKRLGQGDFPDGRKPSDKLPPVSIEAVMRMSNLDRKSATDAWKSQKEDLKKNSVFKSLCYKIKAERILKSDQASNT